MIAVWPSDLPQAVLVDGYSESLGDGRLLTKMDRGPGKSRLLFSAVVEPILATFRVDRDGKARVRRFWREEIGGGSLPFWIRDPVNDGVPLLKEDRTRFLQENLEPVRIDAWLLVTAGGEVPTFTPVRRGLAFDARVSLLVMP